ncbi:SPOR domain-containing protein [Ottowia sp.]|uniref:SPOR domain-containing protein n=1 Tax=Ottowia sp. TaxID=1898956 RepID=UPI003A857C50
MIGRLVVVLIVANLVWAAWSQGWLRGVGLGPTTQTEPERLERQVRPEALHIQPQMQTQAPSPTLSASASPHQAPRTNGLPPAAAQTQDVPSPQATSSQASVPEAMPPESTDIAAAAPPAPTPDPEPVPAPPPAPVERKVCLQAGQFDEPQIAAVRRAAAASLPDGSWRVDVVTRSGRWMVYVGKLADADAVSAKRTEMRNLGVDTDRPGAALEPGLSLGRFSTEEAAQRALGDLGRKGVRSARVVQERKETANYWFRLPKADTALRQQARSNLKSALAGKDFSACD